MITQQKTIREQEADSGVTGSTLPRLGYVDGLRALAALFVVADHACLESGMSYYHSWLPGILANNGRHATLPHWQTLLLQPLMFGHLAVCVFIVLSGYCLALPLRGFTVPLAVRSYAVKRVRRILPPYYAALILSMVYIAMCGSTARTHPILYTTNFWLNADIAFTPAVVFSHVLLIQNLGTWWRHINYPLWSIATECQIYLLFPLLVLIRRRYSAVTMLNAALGLSVGLTVLLQRCHGSMNASPWFVGLFALGMASAEMSSRYSTQATSKKNNWGYAAAVLSIVGILLGRYTDVLWQHLGLMDMFAGAITASLLVYCSIQKPCKRPGYIMSVLESAPLVRIGAFSYSLYLMHVPVLSMCHRLFISPALSPAMCVFLLLVTGTVVSVCLSYLFHLAFERPFMRRSGRG